MGPSALGQHISRLFVLVGHLQQTGLVEHIADQLHTDRQPRWLKPQGTLIAGKPAKLTGIVRRSARYIARGSSLWAPALKAGEGAVGVSSTSTDWNAASKSRRIKVRTWLGFLVVRIDISSGQGIGTDQDPPLDLFTKAFGPTARRHRGQTLRIRSPEPYFTPSYRAKLADASEGAIT